MSRRMDYTLEFDAPAAKIYQDFTGRDYWQTLMDAYRFFALQSEITTFLSGERGTDIVFVQTLPRMYLPPIRADRGACRHDHHPQAALRPVRSCEEPGQGHLLGEHPAWAGQLQGQYFLNRDPIPAAACSWRASARSTSRSWAARWRT